MPGPLPHYAPPTRCPLPPYALSATHLPTRGHCALSATLRLCSVRYLPTRPPCCCPLSPTRRAVLSAEHGGTRGSGRSSTSQTRSTLSSIATPPPSARYHTASAPGTEVGCPRPGMGPGTAVSRRWYCSILDSQVPWDITGRPVLKWDLAWYQVTGGGVASRGIGHYYYGMGYDRGGSGLSLR
eukprot:696225-Rhodomonas_salina.2